MTVPHPSATPQVRIGILEDSRLFSAHLEAIIADDPALSVLFRVETVAAAFAALRLDLPDVLLVDMQLPDGSGLDVVSAASRHPAIRIMMMTVLADRESVLAAFERGAHGYLLKDTPADQIKRNIHALRLGESPVSSAAATHILSLFRKLPVQGDAIAQPTPRERDILGMVAKGLSYTETAQALGISVHTVGDHLKSIYRKLAVSSKNEAVFEARQQGWINLFD